MTEPAAARYVINAAFEGCELVRVAGADHVLLGTDPVPQLDLAVGT